VCVLIYTTKCNIQHLNSGVNKLEVDDLTHVKILMVQEFFKISLNYLSIIVEYWMHMFLYIIIIVKWNLWAMVLIY
jgi:hypothetical protein